MPRDLLTYRDRIDFQVHQFPTENARITSGLLRLHLTHTMRDVETLCAELRTAFEEQRPAIIEGRLFDDRNRDY